MLPATPAELEASVISKDTGESWILRRHYLWLTFKAVGIDAASLSGVLSDLL